MSRALSPERLQRLYEERRSSPGRPNIVDRRTRPPEPQAAEPQPEPDRLTPRRYRPQET